MDTKTRIENTEVKVGFEYVDTNLVCQVLQKTYWAEGRSAEIILSSLRHSICFSLYLEGKQIGFARVVTDYSTFAYLADVFILNDFRGRGYSRKLLETVFNVPDFKNVKWTLRTKDAHGLYEKFGFKRTHRPERYMEKLQPNPQEQRIQE